MVKQKIVIRVTMEDPRKRSKALKTAVGFYGVISATLEGEDKIVVVGDGVDSVDLTTALRKKMCYAELISVGEDKKKEEKKICCSYEGANYCVEPMIMPYNWGYPCVVQEPAYDPNPCKSM